MGETRRCGATVAIRQLEPAEWAVCLELTEGNDAAENLYRRHGFGSTGRRGPVEPGDPRTECEMRRSL